MVHSRDMTKTILDYPALTDIPSGSMLGNLATSTILGSLVRLSAAAMPGGVWCLTALMSHHVMRRCPKLVAGADRQTNCSRTDEAGIVMDVTHFNHLTFNETVA